MIVQEVLAPDTVLAPPPPGEACWRCGGCLALLGAHAVHMIVARQWWCRACWYKFGDHACRKYKRLKATAA